MEELNPTNFTGSVDDNDAAADGGGGAFWAVRTDSRDRSAILVLAHTTHQSSQ